MMSPTIVRSMAMLAWFVLVLFAAPSRADTGALRLDLALGTDARSFEGRLEAFHDRTGRLTRQQVASPTYAQQFERLPGGLNGGYSRGAWWVRFQVQAAPEELARPLQGGWWLRLSAPYADYIDVWLPVAQEDGGTGLAHRELGGMRPAAMRELPWTLGVVRLPALPDAAPHWVWVRLAGDRALSLIGGVSPLPEVAGVQQEITFASAAAIGMVLLMALVSLMMGAALPERRFIGYAGYLFTLALLFWTSENLQATRWFPNHPVIAVRLHSVSVCLHTVAAVAFARSLLDMAHQFPRLDRMFKLLIVAGVAACAMAAAGWYGLIAAGLNLAWVAFAAGVVALCAVLLRRNPETWPSMFGYAVYLAVGVLHFAKNLQWLPYTLATQYSYAIGAIVHILALFFALGWRVRHRERRALALSQRHGERLEQRVLERTHDLREEVAQHRQTHGQLAQALREQRGLLAMVSHEFRTPLGTIGGAAQILSDDRLALSSADVKVEAAKIARTVLRMGDLVDTLLADEWIEATTENLCLAPVDMAGLLREKVEEHNAGAGGGRISLELAQPRMRVLADETLLHIALDNLLANAIKYGPADAAVSVWAGPEPAAGGRAARGAAEPGMLCIRICDEGPGFMAQDLPHVFERFYRAAGVRRVPGIGLGLHMVHRIAKLHAGDAIAANRPGGGAVLRLSLPLCKPGIEDPIENRWAMA
jgi:signal transduction histidine kinase